MNAESNDMSVSNPPNPAPNGTTPTTATTTTSSTVSSPSSTSTSNNNIITAIRQAQGLTRQQMDTLEQLVLQNHTAMTKLSAAYSQLTPQQLEQELLRIVETSELDALSLPPQMVISPTPAAKPPGTDFKAAWEKMISSNPRETANSSGRALAKLIQTARKHPNDPKQRRIRMDNIIAKKFISKVVGAEDFLHSIGFHNTTINNTAYLELEEGKVNEELLQESESFLLEHAGADEMFSGPSSAIASPAMSPQPPKIRVRCVAKCGFFGDEATENLCSVCFKKKYASPSVKPQSEEKTKAQPKRKTWKAKFHMAVVKLRAVHRFRLGAKERPIQKNKSKCWICKKKIGILGFECRCGYTFCEDHRYANQHNCAFDFHKAHQKKLLRENQAIKENKLARLSEDTDD